MGSVTSKATRQPLGVVTKTAFEVGLVTVTSICTESCGPIESGETAVVVRRTVTGSTGSAHPLATAKSRARPAIFAETVQSF
jgi:hypothetical protein